ncbi:MAG: acyl-CoA ligase [Bradyrhizobium sp.]|nr:acyl-CoA ligase [Bradyrhizobium sp.]
MNLLTRSLAQGPTDTPLIDKTVGAFFDEIAAKWPDREAVVSCHGHADDQHLAMTGRAVKTADPMLAAGRVSRRAQPSRTETLATLAQVVGMRTRPIKVAGAPARDFAAELHRRHEERTVGNLMMTVQYVRVAPNGY